MEDWQTRLVAEKDALAEKLTALKAFIGSPALNSLLDDDKHLLWEQEVAMTEYHGILLARIKRAGIYNQ